MGEGLPLFTTLKKFASLFVIGFLRALLPGAAGSESSCPEMVLKCVGWNPLSIAREGRLEEISQELRWTDLIILNGTQRRGARWNSYTTQRTSHHEFIHAGYDRAPCSNRSAGIAIGWNLRSLNRSMVTQVHTAPKIVCGRGLGVRFKGTKTDCYAMGLYVEPMPKAKRDRPRWRQGTQALMTWAASTLGTLGARTTIVLATDLNDRMGIPQNGGLDARPFSIMEDWDDARVGPHEAEHEGEAATRFREVLATGDLYLPTTWAPLGPTFFGPRNHTSRIDFVGVSTGRREATEVRHLWRAGKRLQLIPTKAVRDHIPTLITTDCELHYEGSEQLPGWDIDAIAKGWELGYRKAEFLNDFEQICAQHEEQSTANCQTNSTDHEWEALMTDLQASLGKLYRRGRAPEDEQRRELRREQLQLLRRRGDQRMRLEDDLETTLELHRISRKIRALTRRIWALRRTSIEDALLEAWHKRDFAVSWKLATELAYTCIGIKKTTEISNYDSPVLERMAKRGGPGGHRRRTRRRNR